MENILISKTPIPSSLIGSWNNLLTQLLVKRPNFFEYIISPRTKNKIKNINIESQEYYLDKFYAKYYKKEYSKKKFWRPLEKILIKKPDTKFNVIIFDDAQIALAVDYFSKKQKIRNRIKIIFFLRGFDFSVNIEKRNKIYATFDKLVVQTKSSYLHQVATNHTIPCEVFILPNGIDNSLFYKVDIDVKNELRNKYQLPTFKRYFLWVSQDRPKKGLSIILKAWEELIKSYDDIELIIVGTDKPIKGGNIKWFEKRSNSKLPNFYQLTDYYLFSSLCHEGHSLSLTEALKSGAKCLVSDIAPNSEVLADSKYGYLIENPHNVESWVNAMKNVLEGQMIFNEFDSKDIYCMDDWIHNFTKILN